jgi:hypothetical protein
MFAPARVQVRMSSPFLSASEGSLPLIQGQRRACRYCLAHHCQASFAPVCLNKGYRHNVCPFWEYFQKCFETK